MMKKETLHEIKLRKIATEMSNLLSKHSLNLQDAFLITAITHGGVCIQLPDYDTAIVNTVNFLVQKEDHLRDHLEQAKKSAEVKS